MHFKNGKLLVGLVVSAGLLAAPLATIPAMAADTPTATGPSVVINEAYLSGGSAGAAFRNKFVELYNNSDAAVSLGGWSLQYRAAGNVNPPTFITPLSGTIPAKGFFLVKGASNSASSTAAELPAADVDGSGTLNPSGSAGTLVLAKQGTAVNPLPTGSVVSNPAVADLLGYGSTNTFETAAALAPASNTDVRSLNRTNGADTNNNAADLSLSAAITPTAAGATAPPPTDAGTKTIAEIQGTGAASPFTGATVTTRGKVTAVYAAGGFNGYYVQTPGTGGDTDPAARTASDAIFVYSPSTVESTQIGDYLELTGTVSEFSNQTQLTVDASGVKKLSEAAPEVKPSNFALPADEATRERYEGMLVAPQGAFTVTDNYSLNQYGEIGLAAGPHPWSSRLPSQTTAQPNTTPWLRTMHFAASSSTTARPPTSSRTPPRRHRRFRT